MKIPTLTKGFLRSMAPTLGVATLKESETNPSGLSNVETGEGRSTNFDSTGVASQEKDPADIQTETE